MLDTHFGELVAQVNADFGHNMQALGWCCIPHDTGHLHALCQLQVLLDLATERRANKKTLDNLGHLFDDRPFQALIRLKSSCGFSRDGNERRLRLAGRMHHVQIDIDVSS